MGWNIRKRYRRLIRGEGSDIVIALVTGIVTNLITDAVDRRRKPRKRRDHRARTPSSTQRATDASRNGEVSTRIEDDTYVNRRSAAAALDEM
jgi:hypothetical protein